eukprot:TRINITY_DN12132_c1_g4_i2.p1 TRINITY_DN12132_c1_g4~~TRINITY_DN12132_c1_g4_i2.p1  ORF type:complete len:467 (+),score=93.45 TRINITY_DN12132_c1_g4_i2:99-1403(+)
MAGRRPAATPPPRRRWVGAAAAAAVGCCGLGLWLPRLHGALAAGQDGHQPPRPLPMPPTATPRPPESHPTHKSKAPQQLAGYANLADLRGGLGEASAGELREAVTAAAAEELPLATAKDRRASPPFVTGDGIRLAADCVCDEVGCAPPPHPLPRGAVAFVKTDQLEHWLGSEQFAALQRTAAPFVLVTHNSDYTSPWEKGNTRGKFPVEASKYERHRKLLLDSPDVKLWYGQNPAVVHEKLVPMPIGLENRYNPYGRFVGEYAKLHEEARAAPHGARQGLLFANFNPRTNPVLRAAAARTLRRFGPAEGFTVEVSDAGRVKPPKRRDKRQSLLDYGRRAIGHKYCACPPGHGLDTHRLWESLVVFACIPVVQREPSMMPMLRELPHLAVDDWAEVTPQRLAREYAVISARHDFHLARFYLPYWVREIRSHRAAV